METIQNWFRGESSSAEVPNASVLAEWTKYSSGDLESGGKEESTSLFTETVTNSFKESFNVVSAGVASAQTTVQNVTSMQNWYYFGGLLTAGIIMLFLAFTIALPLVVLSPSKFAFSFSIGSLLILAAFTSLKGWKEQLKHMFSKERILFSVLYLSSVFATLYSAIVMKSYLLSLSCCGLQVVALIYYIVSYFPGGADGAKMVFGMFYRGLLSCCGRLFRSSSQSS